MSSSSLKPSGLEKFKIFVFGNTFPRDEAAKILNNNIYLLTNNNNDLKNLKNIKYCKLSHLSHALCMCSYNIYKT